VENITKLDLMTQAVQTAEGQAQQNKSYAEMYWSEYKQIKAHAIYLDEYLQSLEKRNSVMSKALLIASSGSLGVNGSLLGFAPSVPEYVKWVSNILTLTSQIATVLHFSFDYQRQMSKVAELRNAFDALALYGREQWFKIAEGMLSTEEIHAAIVELDRRRNEAMNEHFRNSSVPMKKRLVDTADRKATKYFETHF
jgi:hypothetical protein